MIKGFPSNGRLQYQDFEVAGLVSVWVSLTNDDLGVDVLRGLCGVDEYDLDDQEANAFDGELVTVERLLADLSYAQTFIDPAVAAARKLGIEKARSVTVQYDFRYDLAQARKTVAKDPVFIGFFPYRADD